jgi:group I intron endonuclease
MTKKSFSQRFSHHKYDLNKNRHGNQYLQNCWNKYGQENFIFLALEIINKTESLDYFLLRENHYINSIKKNDLINLQTGEIQEGKIKINISVESREKMSKSHKGKKLSEEHKKSLSKALLGKKQTDEWKTKRINNMRNTMKSILEKNPDYYKNLMSPEKKKEHSEKYSGANNPFYGKKHTEESLKKIREKRSKQITSDETKKKMSLARKGRIRTEKEMKSCEETYKRKALAKIFCNLVSIWTGGLPLFKTKYNKNV